MLLHSDSSPESGNDEKNIKDSETINDMNQSHEKGVNDLKKISFADHEKERRSRANKRYREKKTMINELSVAARNKKQRAQIEKIEFPWSKCGDEMFSMLGEEINRILKYNSVDRIRESKTCFRWIRPLEDKDKYVLQFGVGESFFMDLVYISKSSIPNADYGLFAATDLPKGIPFSIYMGRVVHENNKSRKYIMQQPFSFVKGKTGSNRWEKVRKGRSCTIIDALSRDDFRKWTVERDFFLGAHIMNDLNFKRQGDTIPCNCVVQPMLEVITAEVVSKDTELFIHYNR